MKTKKIDGDGRVKIDPVTKEKIIQFCIENPKQKQLIADFYNLSLRTIQKYMKDFKEPKPLDANRHKKAVKVMKQKFPNYVA